jgi:hypothetical protein
LKIWSEFVGVRAETLAIFGTMAADLFFNHWDLEVLPDCPAHTKVRPLLFEESLTEKFENFYVKRRCGAPELYAVGPDGFEYCLINENFVVGR